MIYKFCFYILHMSQVLEDETGHPFSGMMADTLKAGGADNLMYKVVWAPTATSVSAAWSRKLTTGDTIADQIINTGNVNVAYAYGLPGKMFLTAAAGDAHGGIGDYKLINLIGSAVPAATGCTTDAQCMNGGACDIPAGACRCATAMYLGPNCAVRPFAFI